MSRRILLVKFGPIGDVVMATPIVEAVARLYPGDSLTWVVSTSIAPLLARLRPAPEVVPLDSESLWRGSAVQRVRAALGLRATLANRSFDLCLLAHAHPRLRHLLWGLDLGELRAFDLRPFRRMPLPGRRHHHEHVRLLVGNDGPDSSMANFPTVAITAPPIALPSGLRIALAPGGARNVLRDDPLRRWPLEHYRELVKLLIAARATPVLVGGPDDTWTKPAFADLPVVDAIGCTSLVGAFDLCAACHAMVAHDSGPMHLADLAGIPVLALFGPTDPSEKAPLGSHSRVLRRSQTLPCMQCYDGVSYARCSANRCLAELPATVVAEAALLTASSSSVGSGQGGPA